MSAPPTPGAERAAAARRAALVLGVVLVAVAVGATLLGWWAMAVDAGRFGVPGPTLGDALPDAVRWACRVTAWSACAMVAGRAGRRGGVAAVVGGAVLAAVSVALAQGVSGTPWPGPWDPVMWVDLDRAPERSLRHPAAWTAALLLGAVVAGALAAPRAARRPPVATGLATGAVVLTVVPAFGLVAAATALHVSVAPPAYVGQAALLAPDVLAPALVGVLVVVAAAAGSGTGPWTFVGLLVAASVLGVEPVGAWLDGGRDTLLLVGVAPVPAAALAWAWRPLARYAADLLVPAAPPPDSGAEAARVPAGSSVGEGADPDL